MKARQRFGLVLILAVTLVMSEGGPPAEWRRAILFFIWLWGIIALLKE